MAAYYLYCDIALHHKSPYINRINKRLQQICNNKICNTQSTSQRYMAKSVIYKHMCRFQVENDPYVKTPPQIFNICKCSMPYTHQKLVFVK